MTLYLDTSSLFKLYVEESGSDEVRMDLAQAKAVATSAVSYAEARAAFARRFTEPLSKPALAELPTFALRGVVLAPHPRSR